MGIALRYVCGGYPRNPLPIRSVEGHPLSLISVWREALSQLSSLSAMPIDDVHNVLGWGQGRLSMSSPPPPPKGSGLKTQVIT